MMNSFLINDINDYTMSDYCALNISIGDLEVFANIIIASLTLILAAYVFIYQRKQDNKQIRLQWFKDLIIKPKLQYVTHFYREISTIKNSFNDSDLKEDDRIEIMNFIKRTHHSFRETFVDILYSTAPNLYGEIQLNLDELIDGLINTLDNDELKLNNPKTYNREIDQKIKKSYNRLYASIFNYKGQRKRNRVKLF